ncbi:MAG: TetR family transcriptional regulator [Pseudomonadota bacterium]|uniref:TetR/AcrR family transcriptional regulator n=1 Tax=Hyphomonas sp. BRH_c22 TaxID=1629710 RepID=UPI000A5C58B5|nr:TetR/AcrR family transcriptional regulator [Hyphomonas sp. BRH_c22]
MSRIEKSAGMSKGEKTRERLLEIAQASVLDKGFSNTSIDEIISAAEITKSGFFYHFKDKTDLAKALLVRYLAHDDLVLDGIFARARELSDDPLHAFLIGLKMFAESMGEMETAHPGCMVAAVAYHDKQFNDDVRRINATGVLTWRSRFHDALLDIAEVYPPRVEVDLEAMADMVSTIVEGGIILSRVLDDPKILEHQIMLYRTQLKLVFLGA